MVRYLLVFLEPHQTLNEVFSSWRKEILSGWVEFSPFLYLDADDPITSRNKYRHANIYQIRNDGSLELARVDERLQLYSSEGRLVSYHWQLHDGISQLRQSPLSTVTVVTIGMTVPDNTKVIQELNQWYEQEHMPALATVPGWLGGTRMKLTHASNQHGASAAPYLAVHEWGNPNSLGGDAWKRAVMTPWTEKISALHTAPPYRRVWRVSD
ncbi:hypothetical protein BDW72DRAFT_196233 [Aspergillus terricola var. indicus]